MTGGAEHRARLETALRGALRDAGATRAVVESVLAGGCRLDGVGAAAVSGDLARAGERARRRVEELAAALDRLDRAEFGRCEGCGEEIDAARLGLLPATRLCRRCADELGRLDAPGAGPVAAPAPRR